MRRDRHVVLLEELLVIHAGCLGPTARVLDSPLLKRGERGKHTLEGIRTAVRSRIDGFVPLEEPGRLLEVAGGRQPLRRLPPVYIRADCVSSDYLPVP